MQVKRLGSESGELDTVEINYHLLSFRALLRHLRRLPGCKVGWRFSWPLTDDHWADFEYAGFRFQIDSPFVDYWVHKPTECPEAVFLEVAAHMESHQPSALRRWLGERSERRRAAQIARLRRGSESGS